MKVEICLGDLDDLDATITVTASVGQLKVVVKQLEEDKHYCGVLGEMLSTIRKSIYELEKTFTQHSEKK
jgi:hypothetical protein